jgi:pheromone shutdown protein TraB
LEPSLLLFFVIVVAIPVVGALSMNAFQRWLQHKERMGALTAEKAAQYASHVERLEARLRVVEQIVTDGGAQTAAQIEALRPTQRAGPGKVVGTQTTA